MICLLGDSRACQADSQYERWEQQEHLVADSSQRHRGLQSFPLTNCPSLYFACDCSSKTHTLLGQWGRAQGGHLFYSVPTPWKASSPPPPLTFFSCQEPLGKTADVSRCLNSNVFYYLHFLHHFQIVVSSFNELFTLLNYGKKGRI